MHRLACVITILAVSAAAVSVRAQWSMRFLDQHARDVFIGGRAALGQSESLALKSLLLSGRSRSLDADGMLTDAAVEVRVLLPDRYLRIDSAPFGDKLTGYAGGTLLDAIRTGRGITAPAPRAKRDLLRNDRERLLRFMVGAAAYVPSDTIAYARSTGADIGFTGGKTTETYPADADRIEVHTDEGATFDLVVDRSSHAPLRIIFQNSAGEQVITTFSDRRPEGGLALPHHVVTTMRGQTTDELTFDRMLVNPPLDEHAFAQR